MSTKLKLNAYLELQTYSAGQRKFIKQALRGSKIQPLINYLFLHMTHVISNNIDDHLLATGFSLPDKINGVGNPFQALRPDK